MIVSFDLEDGDNPVFVSRLQQDAPERQCGVTDICEDCGVGPCRDQARFVIANLDRRVLVSTCAGCLGKSIVNLSDQRF